MLLEHPVRERVSRTRQAILWTVASLFVLAAAVGVAFYRDPLAFSDARLRLHLYQQHVQSNYVQVDGYRMHYLEAVPPHGMPGQPLVLIHGLGARAEDWSALIPALAAHGFHVYVPDLLGYGRSPHPDVSYSIHLQEQTVVDFMQTLHIQQADLGGWSMGGWIALKLTVDHPELVNRLVVYDSAGIYFPPTFNAGLFTPEDAAGLNQLIGMLTPQPFHLPPFAERAAIRRLQSNAWVIDRSVDEMVGGHDLLDFQLHRIHKPVLFIWGKEDLLIPPSVGGTMHRNVSGSSLLLVEGCGHLAPAECSRPIVRATLQFLTAAPDAPAYERTIPGH